MVRISKLLLMALVITLLFIAIKSFAGTVWFDDFESYQTDTFPSSQWTYSGNPWPYLSFVDESIKMSGDKSLKLFGWLSGCDAALAHRPITVQPPYIIHFYVYNGSESLSGCHSHYGAVQLNTGPSWTYPVRPLINFYNNDLIGGQIIKGASNNTNPTDGVDLGTFTSDTWYEVQIKYEIIDASTVRLSYWINGEFKNSYDYASLPYENYLSFIAIQSGEGSAWFDDVSISTLIPLVECNLVPDWPVVVQGGTLGLQATATNNTDEVQIFKYATRITLPNGNKYPYAGYLVGPIEVTLNPHQSKSKHLSQYVPHYAPLGTYIYHGYVGNYGVGIYDECTFNFTVNSQGHQDCTACHQ